MLSSAYVKPFSFACVLVLRTSKAARPGRLAYVARRGFACADSIVSLSAHARTRL